MITAVADRPVQTLLSLQLRWIAVLLVGSALYAAVLSALLGTGDVCTYRSCCSSARPSWRSRSSPSSTDWGGAGCPSPQVATAAALGGVVGMVIAGPLEYGTARQLGSLSTWAVGLIEEAAKLAGLGHVSLVGEVLVRRSRLRCPSHEGEP
jgi:hypothetical protein